jgi:hypothetical protein
MIVGAGAGFELCVPSLSTIGYHLRRLSPVGERRLPAAPATTTLVFAAADQ